MKNGIGFLVCAMTAATIFAAQNPVWKVHGDQREMYGGKFEVPGYGQKSFMVAYPNKALTPGHVSPTVTIDDVCHGGYAKRTRRELTKEEKVEVYKRYGLKYDTSRYQIDHLIPLGIGGDNDPSNLWPQPIINNAGFYEKQQVASWLHDNVCKGKTTMKDAQKVMMNDWHEGWRNMRKERYQSVP